MGYGDTDAHHAAMDELRAEKDAEIKRIREAFEGFAVRVNRILATATEASDELSRVLEELAATHPTPTLDNRIAFLRGYADLIRKHKLMFVYWNSGLQCYQASEILEEFDTSNSDHAKWRDGIENGKSGILLFHA